MIKADVSVKVGYTDNDIREELTRSLPIAPSEIKELRILKRTLVNVGTRDISYKMSVAVSLSDDREAGLLKMKKKVSEAPDYTLDAVSSHIDHRPVVVGAGPSGLFAALYLSETGARPIILERGLPVEERDVKIKEFYLTGKLDPECNVQFGEGGAGTYSDGKLKVGSMDKYKHKVLSEFVLAGAEEEILYATGAHLGTDKLPFIVKAIREKIISLGGEFIFSAKATDLGIKDGEVTSVSYEKNGIREKIETKTVVIAAGHSAEDTFRMLLEKGLIMEPRGFGIGVRIEHPREYIDSLVYGNHHPDGVGTASYHLVSHLPSGRSVYSFCMCPGGTVVAATGNEGSVVTNGMSEHARMGRNSNSALLVSVTPKDFGFGVLDGIKYQRKLENAVFNIAGKNYKAPAQRLSEFMTNRSAKTLGEVIPTYPRGTEPISPDEYLPEFITDSLRGGILDFDNWMHGFNYGDAVLTGAETRSTSPIRVLRGENYLAVGIKGLYPVGEGAGYAGGIVSSAVDGLKCAEALMRSFV